MKLSNNLHRLSINSVRRQLGITLRCFSVFIPLTYLCSFVFSDEKNTQQVHDIAYSMDSKSFWSLSHKDQINVIRDSLLHRTDVCTNIHYEATELLNISDYDSNGIDSQGSVRDVKQLLNGRKVELKRFGDSFRMDYARGGHDVSDPSKWVSINYKADEGLSRSLQRSKSDQRLFGRIGTAIDKSVDSDRYRFWLDGNISTQGDFIIKSILESVGDWSLTKGPSGEIVVSMPWVISGTLQPNGKREVHFDSARGFLPYHAFSLWKRSDRSWRHETMDVLASIVVDDIAMPQRLREIICSSSFNDPNLCNVHDTEVTFLEAGKVTLSDIELEFPPGTVIVDATQGKAQLMGEGGKVSREADVLKSTQGKIISDPPPSAENLHGNRFRTFIIINLSILSTLILIISLRRLLASRRRARDNPETT